MYKKIILSSTFLFIINNSSILLHQIPHRNNNMILASYFSPHDNIIELLVDCIKQEKEAITVLAYCFTHPHIARALKDTAEKNIPVTVIADHTKATDPFYNRALRNIEHDVNIKLYQAPENGIMHNKCMIFNKNIDNKPLLITGSFNFTRSAQRKNSENIIITNDEQLYTLYKKEAVALEKKSTPFTETTDRPKHKNLYISVKKEEPQSLAAQQFMRKKR